MTPVQVSRLVADTIPSRMESFHPAIQWPIMVSLYATHGCGGSQGLSPCSLHRSIFKRARALF